MTGKVTANLVGGAVPVGALRPQHRTRSRTAPTRNTPPNGWGDQLQLVQLDQPQSQLGARRTRLNEFIFQYADFRNDIGANSPDPYQLFPNGVAVGQSPNTPQTTEQKKWQFRDDFSWS